MASDHSVSAQRPRIALVVGQLSHGGAERQLVLLAEGLLRSGEFEPLVFCLSPATHPYGPALDEAGVAWYGPPQGLGRGLPRLLWLVRQLRAARCSLVYGLLNVGNIYGGAAALVVGHPFVASIRNADPSLSLVLKTLSGFFCRRARLVIANSPSCAASLREDLGVRHGRVRVVPNAVATQPCASTARSRLRREWGIPETALVVGTLANLKLQKRPDFFLQVAALCARDNPSLHFVWVGDGAERPHVECLLAQVPLLAASVHFPGARRDVADCLSAFDVFVLTSSYEGLPNALLEAMAFGLPCVATDVPGTRDIFYPPPQAEIGVLADPDHPPRFAGALLSLLSDPERMRRMGQTARQHVLARYPVPAMVDAFCGAFRDALAG